MTRGRPSLGRLTLLAAGDLRAQPLRSALSVLVLVPLAISWFLLASIASSLHELGRAGEQRNLVVTDVDVFDVANIALRQTELAAAAAAAGDRAESVTPLVLRLVEVEDRVLQVRAADAALWSSVYGLQLLSGVLPDPLADEMAVTRAVQVATGWELGDTARVFGTTFTITAILQGSGSKVASLWLPLDRAERLFERPGEYQFVVVRLRAGVDGDAVKADLRLAFPTSLVMDESAVQAEATRGVRSLGDLALVFTALGILGLAVGSANATALVVAERRRSLGLLRVVGFAPDAVRTLLAVRAVLLAAGALLVGLAIAWPLVATRPSFVLRSFTIDPRVSVATIAIGCLLSLGSAYLGAIVAGGRALRSPTRDLLEA